MPVVAFALIVAVCQWWLAASIPFLSESYTLLDIAARQPTWSDALDPALTPFRPFQHLFFWVLAHSGIDSPAPARVPAHLLHAGCIVLVDRLARALGLRTGPRWLAVVAFAAFPNCQGTYWVAGIATPARAMLQLSALLAAVHHARSPGWRSGAAMLIASVLALACHEMAIAGPLFVVALLAACRRQNGEAPALAWRRAMTAPWGMTLLACGACYLLYVMLGRADHAHPFSSPAAIAANGARAAMAYVPQDWRLLAVDALRAGSRGEQVTGGLLGLAALALLGVLARSGGLLGRLLVTMAMVDLVLPVISAGFVIRYAYLGAGFVSLAMAMAVNRATGVGAVIRGSLVGVVALLWAWDSGHQIQEHREAGTIVNNIVDAAVAARARWPEREIALVDAPAMWGREHDIVVFNWGLPQALARRGAAGPWRTVRTSASWTRSDHRSITSSERDAMLGEPGLPVVTFDAASSKVSTRAPTK